MTTQDRVNEHYEEAKQYFAEKNIIGIFLQGSQNYHLETEQSDVDTKLLVVPTFEDLAFNKSPISTTHVRANNEHIDFKDIRLMFNTFRKQNINFIEILFTDYFVLNPYYAEEWQKLIDNREMIAHYNQFVALKTMSGMAYEKFKGMEHPTPAREEIVNKFGYDPKQLHHLLRFEEFIQNYSAGKMYQECLIPEDTEYLKNIKLGALPMEEARVKAREAISKIDTIMNNITKDSVLNTTNFEVDKLLNEIQLKIMKKAILNR